jgi:ribosome-associated toxin RatA of RatAB toxin-antitoxin module
MTIIDERTIRAPVETCFQVAADVERWPDILPHYRFVRFREKSGFGTGIVEMSAYRDFGGPLRYPTWWLSDMHVDDAEPAVHYTHVDGFTRGMIVKWSFDAIDASSHAQHTHVRISHAWDGPPWPLIGALAWEHFISSQFVSFIATRTLAGVTVEAERRAGPEKYNA